MKLEYPLYTYVNDTFRKMLFAGIIKIKGQFIFMVFNRKNLKKEKDNIVYQEIMKEIGLEIYDD